MERHRRGRGCVGNVWRRGLSRCLTDEMQMLFSVGGLLVRQVGLTCRSSTLFHFLFVRLFFFMDTRCTLLDGGNNHTNNHYHYHFQYHYIIFSIIVIFSIIIIFIFIFIFIIIMVIITLRENRRRNSSEGVCYLV